MAPRSGTIRVRGNSPFRKRSNPSPFAPNSLALTRREALSLWERRIVGSQIKACISVPASGFRSGVCIFLLPPGPAFGRPRLLFTRTKVRGVAGARTNAMPSPLPGTCLGRSRKRPPRRLWAYRPALGLATGGPIAGAGATRTRWAGKAPLRRPILLRRRHTRGRSTTATRTAPAHAPFAARSGVGGRSYCRLAGYEPPKSDGSVAVRGRRRSTPRRRRAVSGSPPDLTRFSTSVGSAGTQARPSAGVDGGIMGEDLGRGISWGNWAGLCSYLPLAGRSKSQRRFRVGVGHRL